MMTARLQAHHLRHPQQGDDHARHHPLRCVTTGFLGGRYEVRSMNRCVGMIRLRGLFRPRVLACSDEGEWIFEPSGHWLVVRSGHSHHELATIDMSFSRHGGILRFRDGRTFIYVADFWKGRAEFQTPSGDPVMQFRFHGLLRPSAEVEIHKAGRQLSELTWLPMLGWSLIVGYL